MKKDAYYFSHDANAQDDHKCIRLIDVLGMEGYGIFWALIEKLRSENDYKLPLDCTGGLAKRWGTSKEKVDAVICNFNLFLIENSMFFSQRLIRSMQIYKEKSEKGRKFAEKRWGTHSLPNANPMGTHSLPNANPMQLKEIKEKEIKEKEIKEKEIKTEDAPIQEIYEYYLKQTNKTKDQYQLSSNRLILLRERLRDGFTVDSLKNAVDRFLKDPWEGRKEFDGLEHLLKTFEQTEKFANKKEKRYIAV